MKQIDWTPYTLPEYDHCDFPAAAQVLDLGFGAGDQLRQLVGKGCRVVGVEVQWRFAKNVGAQHCPILVARGESLPFRANTFDGIVCKGVLMLTREEDVLDEIARILRPGAEMDLALNGSGYYLAYVLRSPNVKHRVYGLRTLLNTWLYRWTRRRLPGFLGDTIYDDMPALQRNLAHSGLAIVRFTPSPRFLGLPVFLYMRVRKQGTGEKGKREA